MRRSRSCSSRYTSLSTSSTYVAMRETNASRAGAPSTTARATAGWSTLDQADEMRSCARRVGWSASEGRPPVSCGLLSRDSNSAIACFSSAGGCPLPPERSTCTVIQYDCILRLPARLIAAALPVDNSVNTVALIVAASASATMVPSAIPSLTTSDSTKKRRSIFMTRTPGRRWLLHALEAPFCHLARHVGHPLPTPEGSLLAGHRCSPIFAPLLPLIRRRSPLETDPHAAWREAFEKYPSTPERRGARAHDSLIGIK